MLREARIETGRKFYFTQHTKIIKVSEKKMGNDIYSFIPNKQEVYLPLYACSVQAGFPSPAHDYIDTKLDLNDYLIKNPASTFFVRVSGRSMEGYGIWDGDILIVDRSLKVKHNKIVVAVIDNELTIKRYIIRDGKTFLSSGNSEFKDIAINSSSQMYVWGVVTSVIHQFN